ncbi:MAG: hypothetical protein EBZ69_09090 [Alphaproteobacteria bacterium]|nr:hypothetical protein [Alphaproteobacteria bacterium]NDC56939.1 hypothetical protein [Alphaproteobacteria bacterium]NDG05240.1 hypothetical protein [Alphaproteobacteria bacterium]
MTQKTHRGDGIKANRGTIFGCERYIKINDLLSIFYDIVGSMGHRYASSFLTLAHQARGQKFNSFSRKKRG